ncbi:hypothetical protein QFZ22_000048 [Streptomyces canus]|uniref:Uncharacterized protein n=1 Tax=Streptomyces canus TaxID=58343 RepID=A0AAW8F2N7_9ACTN|nr:hypothetical protein [Streptomyces canus]MDQ0904063.1 hypothetical protein [Streptomyces canus]
MATREPLTSGDSQKSARNHFRSVMKVRYLCIVGLVGGTTPNTEATHSHYGGPPMSHAVMITTPARNAMEGHGLTDARTILASDADLHPKRQGLSVAPRAVAYSVYCPATERYSLVTLDGRWIIPGREGYKSRGPVATYARKNIATVRPDALVILEPVRHNGPFKATQYGRRPGTCRQAIGEDWRGIYGYACSCGAGVQPAKVAREGWVIVRDGRGTHTVSYALRSEHRREYGTVPMEVPERANVVVAGAPEAPAVKTSATVDAPAESGPVAESAPVPAPVAEVGTPEIPADAEAPFCAPYSVAEYSITPEVSAVGRIAYGALKPVKRWKVLDANGRVASEGHLSRLAADTRADFLNGESGHAQTPDTCPEGTPDNVRPLVSAGAHGRAYVTGGGARLNIESADGRARFTLHTVPDEAHQEARDGFHKRARELSGEIVKRADGRPVFKPAKVQMWSGKPAPRKAFEPKDYAPGSMLAWTVDGVRFTGQVWANRVQSGKWNGDRGETSAVVVATVNGRRARRDEAVCLPFVHGSRRKSTYAFVATQYGNADVEVIAPECASDGLFDVVAMAGDPVEGWESEGGYVPGVEPADVPAEHVDAGEPAPAETSEPADAPREVPAGEHCPRCDRNTLYGIECAYCGHVIITALIGRGPRLCPAEEKAMATGRQYCPRCFTVGVALYATTLHTGPGYVCAECYTAHGRRLPEAGPTPVKPPAGAVVRAARAAHKEAEEAGATVGEIHRAGEAARKAVAMAYGQRPADVISDPCSVDVWEGEGGACVGVDRPSAPDAGRGAGPVGTDPSPEMGTCTAPAVDVTPVRPDAVSGTGAGDTWDGEGAALPGAEVAHVPSVEERGADDPYTVRPAAPEWTPVPGTNSRTAELTCAGRQYRVSHAPEAVLPYTVRYTLGGADVDLGGWVGLDDVRAIVRADRRRSAALDADRRRIEQEQRRAAYRMRGERRQATVRLTAEERRAIARRAEEKHRPVTAELYVSPITGRAVLAWVCGTCNSTHDDHLWRPQTIGGSYRTPLSVELGTLAALVEKRGWTVTGTWTVHGTRGDTMRATIAPTPAYLAWVESTYGPDPAMPEVEAGERIVPVQRGWWDVVSKEGHRYELTVRPALTGPVWSVRFRSADGFETVAATGMAGTVLIGMRAHSTERGHQLTGEGPAEAVHVPLAS